MKRITIGAISGVKPQPLTLGIDSLIESKLLVQANSGGGKSNTIRLLFEQLSPHLPCVIIDPEGEFSTLREKVDLVLVGDGGELAASPKNAGELAIKILSLGVSAVIDLYTLVPAERREWVRRYCENIIAVNKKLWRPFVLFIDEAQMFAPQDADSVSHGPVIEMMTLARKRDICAILVTPRLAALSTDARAPVNNFLIGRATLDNDYKRAGEILGMPPAERRTLAGLKKGQFHAFGPSFGHDGVAFAQLDKAQTSPAKTGTASKAVPAPSAAIRAVIPELEKIATAENPDEVTTIDKARARIKELGNTVKTLMRAAQAPAAKAPAQVDVAAVEARVEARVRRQAQAELKKSLSPLVRRLAGTAEKLARAGEVVVEEQVSLATSLAAFTTILEAPMPEAPVVARLVQPAPTAPRPAAKSSEPAQVGDPVINKTQQRVLDALAWFKALKNDRPSQKAIGAIAGVDTTGGYWGKVCRPLEQAALITRADGYMCLTDAGERLANATDLPGDLGGYHSTLIDRIDSTFGTPSAKMLRFIIDQGRRTITNEEIGVGCVMDTTGGYYGKVVRPLATLGLIERGRGTVTPTDILYPEGL